MCISMSSQVVPLVFGCAAFACSTSRFLASTSVFCWPAVCALTSVALVFFNSCSQRLILFYNSRAHSGCDRVHTMPIDCVSWSQKCPRDFIEVAETRSKLDDCFASPSNKTGSTTRKRAPPSQTEVDASKVAFRYVGQKPLLFAGRTARLDSGRP